MKVFLTGGAGMVGRNILGHPHSGHHKILYPSSTDLNLLDRDAVHSVLSAEMPDIVIHAAGRVGGIQANMANPVNFLRDNLDMGVNVISASSSLGIPKLLNLGSSCMYPRDAVNPLIEEIILKGELEPTNEGYALAKIVASRLCEYIRREDDTKNYKTAIPCNLYGPYDKYEEKHSHMIPAVIRRLHEASEAKQKVVDIWGDGSARREFMSVRDFADFIFYALDNFDSMPQNLNVGIGRDYSIKEYYQSIASVVGYEGTFQYDTSKPTGMLHKLVDIKKLSEFGWQNKLTLKEGLEQAYTFFLNRLKDGI
jgi:GDP-L-fucose synthase